MSIKIKPCPFCGNTNPRCKGTTDHYIRVICHKCFARGPMEHTTWEDESPDKAIAAWNTRPESGHHVL